MRIVNVGLLSLLLFFYSFLSAQKSNDIKNICLTPPVPPVFLPTEPNSLSSSRSGNNYNIPFDTVAYNTTLGSKGFDVVICIDGVVDNTQIALADNYVDSLVERFQNVAHYAPRFKYFNIYRIAKLSSEEGASWGFTNDTSVNNRYGSRFNAYNLPRLLIPQKPDTLFADINEFVPQVDLVLMLVFDKKYGGSGISYYDGRKVACFSIDQETGYHLSDEVIIHEMQHIMPFAGQGYLGDEYEDSLACIIYDTIPESPNVTSDTTSNRKWQHCAGLPNIGFYKEAGICTGNYRPTPLCAMRQVYNFPDFCAVCRENSIAYFDSIINPVYYSSPTPPSFTGNFAFRVEVDTPLVNTYKYEWFLNDSLLVTNSDSLSINFDWIDRTKNYLLRFVCTDMDVYIVDTSLRRPWVTEWTLLTKDTTLSVANEEAAEFRLFPNPVNAQLHGELKRYFSEFAIEIIAPDYSLVMERAAVSGSSFDLDTSDLPSGIYYLLLKGRDGLLLARKFVKKR